LKCSQFVLGLLIIVIQFKPLPWLCRILHWRIYNDGNRSWSSCCIQLSQNNAQDLWLLFNFYHRTSCDLLRLSWPTFPLSRRQEVIINRFRVGHTWLYPSQTSHDQNGAWPMPPTCGCGVILSAKTHYLLLPNLHCRHPILSPNCRQSARSTWSRSKQKYNAYITSYYNSVVKCKTCKFFFFFVSHHSSFLHKLTTFDLKSE